ncbi:MULTISPECIES: molybdopterin-binding protein [unclassified Pseudodesulfovibrio]|uniref:molybdopterin-binding protein n=1 Tax=unclassified Pseudodesulfovibrio TaxID=2661612 RepID=UPI000FEC0D6B|nr:MULTISPECIES: molybdopterin-binding protein [unclassified Pseudodesulfovibrio]MCJ2164733.1 molybdopterin-binding protein [Pseudodesulfovibrio sp. S3-i]RWU04078.1 molybdopterin-binding protein [Pseudodesulfovibrio sp. S3]
MKTIHVENAVGTVLCHDITRIIPGSEKGPAFRRGHVVTEADIPTLLDIGKEHLYVFDPRDGYVHEDEAARRIAEAAAGPGITLSAPVEGKITLCAAHDGLLDIDTDILFKLNSVKDVIFGTIHTNQLVSKGRAMAGTRVIPLVVTEEIVAEAETLLRTNPPLIQVRPLKPCRVGIVTTGSEVYNGRIKDKFGPVIRTKFKGYGSTPIGQKLVSDDPAMTVEAIQDFIADGADFVVVTGGMSVDPDDQTPASIRRAGAEVVAYGAPTFPGAMFMLAKIGDVPVVGLPGCVMYYRASIFDLIIPRILAGKDVTHEDILNLGHGGFCEGCAECRYPVCGFGKGA